MLTVNRHDTGPVLEEIKCRLAALPDRVKGFKLYEDYDIEVRWVERFVTHGTEHRAEVIRLYFQDGRIHEWCGVQGSWNTFPTLLDA